ncbi:MAG: Flp pilus assembly protein CpaB [Acetobacter sp.]|nr:Flp pilus assembly protein CpaB [Acetobacter sp.]
MNPKVMLFLFFGVGIVGVVMFLHATKPAILKPEPPKKVYVHVFVAKHNLQKGDWVSLNDLTEKTFVLGKQPVGALLTTQEVAGHAVRFPIAAGKVIVGSDLISQSDPDFLAYALPPGKGAISIALTRANAVDNFIQPGERVDVFVRINRPTTAVSAAVIKSQVILRNLRVLSVNHSLGKTFVREDQSVEARMGRLIDSGQSQTNLNRTQAALQRNTPPMEILNPNMPLVVTLEVTPEESATLMQAVNTGTVSLMLRSAQGNRDTGQSFAMSGDALSGETLIYNGPGGQ